MAADEKWYFTKEQLANTPSRKFGYDADKELSCRQQAANFIQDMGQRLQVTQLCINTAIVYMHRFYMFHSFNRFHRSAMAAAALFLAAKVEEQLRKLEHVIKVAQICLHRDMAPPDVKSEAYMEQAQELVVNENILLQTLGFDVAIDHPHTHVVKCCHLVKASKDLAQTSYFMASNSLHLTTMCLQYKPTVVACFCIHLACKWSNWEFPQSTEGKPWFWYIDKTVTFELLEQLAVEFLAIFDKCPSRLKRKIGSLSQSQNPMILSQFNSAYKEEKKRNGDAPVAGSYVPSITPSATAEEMKKKQEHQRHHPDYKKHHMPLQPRADAPSKSSCMFGLPQRTQPPPHSSSVSNSSHQSRPMPKPVAPEVGNIGKPEHLHHRPRRPEDKHVRNHEHIPPQYKRVENKTAPGVLNDFPQIAPNVSSRSAVNYNANTPSSYLVNQQNTQIPMHQPQPPIPDQSNLKESYPLLPNAPKIMAHVAPKPKSPPPPPITIKIERSIFSPEKSTPPFEATKPTPIPPSLGLNINFTKNMSNSNEELLIPKQEPISSIEIEHDMNISSLKEEIPDVPDIPIIEEPEPFQLETAPIVIASTQPPVPAEEHVSHKDQKKKKKKHKEHKEKHKEKRKHHKHKTRDPGPIVITIPKEKLNLPPPEHGLKIKIARDKITTPIISSVESSGFKIKISQGKIKESRKRERSEERSPGLSTKHHRSNGTSMQIGTDPSNKR